MQVTVSYTAEDRLKKFFDWLKKRAADKIHEDNKDLIADFVEKVLVIELKRTAEAEHKIFEESIEIPDEVILEPLKRAKEQFDSAFEAFLNKSNIPSIQTSSIQTEATPTQDPFHLDNGSGGHSITYNPGVITRKRTGNGHKSDMKRKLNDQEKDLIREEFITLNGQIHEDACVEVHKKLPVPTDIGIFQVTGFVSYLHFQVAARKIIVRDLQAYETFLQAKYAKLWAQYQKIKANPTLKPQFAARPRRGSSN